MWGNRKPIVLYLFCSVSIIVVLLSMAMVTYLEKIQGKYLFETNENDLATTKSEPHFVLSRETFKNRKFEFSNLFFLIQRSLSCCIFIRNKLIYCIQILCNYLNEIF